MMKGDGIEDRKLREALERLAGFRKSANGRALTVAELNAVNERIAQAVKAVDKAERQISTVNASLVQARRDIATLSIINPGDFAKAKHDHSLDEIKELPKALATLSGAVPLIFSNSNGVSVRFPAIHWQICISPTWTHDVTVSVGGLFRSTEQAWTFPQSFSEAPMMSATCSNASDVWATARSGAASTGAGRMFAPTSIAGRTLRMRAEGPYTS